MKTALSVLAACVLTACATQPIPAPQPVRESAALDAAAYRHALEEAYTEILERSGTTAAPAADIDAAASMPIPQHRSISGALNYFSTDLKPSIQTSLIRAAKYRKLIDASLAAEKLPAGLAYLPVIESAYVPTLTSKAGAHGIWQFMPDTAREYGLRVDWWVDERADPELSTHAAAAYLRDLYRQFSDWPLALAAYNAGPGRIKRALTETAATSFWELLDQGAIPRETRGYVPTFFATLMIVSDPDAYGFHLEPPIESSEHKVEIEGPVSLQYVAEVAKVDEDLLRELNPALRRGVVPPGRVTVRVPSSVNVAVSRDQDPYLAYTTYTLRPRDTAQRLARAIGTTAETIVAMNGRVRPGDTIYLPVRARELASLLAEDAMYYAVRKGDTMYSIARRYALLVDELLEINQLSPATKLHIGQKLRVGAPRALTAGGG